MTFTQEGFNHIWIENITESDLLHSTTPLLLLPSNVSAPTTKRTFVYAFIPPPIQETYKHSSKIDLNIAYNHGFEDSNTLTHEIETVFSKPPYPTSIIHPTTPIQLSIPKQIKVRIHQYSRIHKIYPTPKDLLKTIHKQIPPRASSSYSKRRNTVAIIGVPQCQHIHPGALAYLKNILTSPTMELHGPHPGSCLSSAKSTPIQGNHYQRMATSVRFVALFIDLLHDSWGGAIVPDLLYHALAWDVNVMIVSRYNYSRAVPPNSVSWIDPTRVDAPGFLREVETRDANWKRDEEWRSGISRTMEAGGSVDVESVLGKDFLKLWYTNVVCDLCESARNIDK
ncbi:hypothetical protein BCR33DRAFT_728069 [Rhizoclosmatium globosum]|uniref:Uncharacterized protein n=1 Tax=Rhizoclosmatium globosum TaxID=329046 RepID=A0A1Y2ALW1_9FUNG|nr:hypothetical protein BCR33DRAFT_728069 [Rhizoclosmatium globosum]|eukprot:ORY23472.1 hypothetical protein BCR33DRAFT_728069 [Rhizoclosmatium globosum]